MTAPLFTPLTGWAKADKLKNWAGNLEYSTERLDQAKTLGQVQEIVKKYPRLKVLGTRHCFNNIADTKDQFISLVNAEEHIVLDEKNKTVTVNSGMKYGQLSPYMHKKGFALHNLASLPHISVAGACATATHGSGDKNGNLATAVSAMEMVTAAGEVVQLSRKNDGEKFNAAVVNLGALGVVTKVTLDMVPTFMMGQFVYENLPLDQLKDNFEKIESSGYSVSLFTNWQSKDITEVWVKQKIEDGKPLEPEKEFFGAKLATKNLHPIPELSAENCTEQMGVSGPWYERMPHFKMGFTPSSGVELQSEFFVPRKNAVDAIMAISKLGNQVGPHLLTSEIRTIAADDFWMSPCYKQDSVAIHFTWKQEWDAVSKLLPIIERELAPYDVRPHWGKLFSVSPDLLAKRYVKMEEFITLAIEMDPKGKFRNDFLNLNIFRV
ncbi:FAD-binding protein [Dyadobacter sp. CY399]|uniref:FAD-binding protein n=1 Tax=Dyadobacter fanqingshengii TaxID=2906443 RepID=A0A9X1PBA8_9BACT|nr:D-arabinono-1,4-lactone oxidase [Dyadobacter fanqingshengii]MCF0042091.1 FAD-binding protein [Dyadobacter fanqingshengii]USJ35373.1 FAD-binding protein [Dyadobacter fanqingshengii]